MAIQQVTLVGVGTLDLTGLGQGEALLSAAMSLDLNLRHNRKLLFLFFCFFSGLGGQEDGHMSTFHLGLLVQNGGLTALVGELDQQVLTDFGVSHFTAAEADGDLDTVALAQELLGAAQLHVEVVDVNAGGHTDFFDFDYALVFAGFLLALGLLEAELAVVHDFAHGGDGVGRDLDQVKALLLGQLQCILSGHDTELFAGVGDQTNLFVADFLIELMICGSDGKHLQTKIIAAAETTPAQRKHHR